MTKPVDMEFEDFKSASVTDCTGLIARAPENDYEYDSYFDIMNFSPSDYKSEENSRKAHRIR